MSKKFSNVRGTRDIIFEEAEKFLNIIDTARKISKLYGYSEVILPTIEYYELFAKKSGYEINKRMYVFEDLARRKVALRPELTPSVARLFINKLQHLPKPIRLSYFANVFRYDEPQKARYREFWQAGFEHLGSQSILADCEVVIMCNDIFKALGITNIRLKIGHMGIIKEILKYAGINDEELLYFLYLIDKKNFDELKKLIINYKHGEEAYNILSNLSGLKENFIDEAKELINIPNISNQLNDLFNFVNLLKNVGINGINIDLSFARGIEYYTGIIYEYYTNELDVSIGGGGRYDFLIEYYGGPKTPATGCALGIDRILLVTKLNLTEKPKECVIYPLTTTEKSVQFIFRIIRELSRMNYVFNIDTKSSSLKESLSNAVKKGASFFIIIGEKEATNNMVIIRNLLRKAQFEVNIENIKDWFLKNAG
ncbi:MAG: histidine--tRNA ligase [Thermoproteota archaeon]|jgi:histidyl-tRNA synthetase